MTNLTPSTQKLCILCRPLHLRYGGMIKLRQQEMANNEKYRLWKGFHTICTDLHEEFSDI